ncbi:MAG: hypothetical protein ACN6QH_01345 [Pseudomonas sp.]|uniref:hypothetical protein n=1 Tax=Pseudomonas sp. TaxID=306 RepID=UPI003D10B179
MGIARAVVVMLAFVVVSGCTLHKQWRDDKDVCVITASDKESELCQGAQLQRFSGAAEYTVGYVELRDRGELFSRPQMNNVLDALYEKAGKGDVLMVVFAHGWNHRAKEGDGNIYTFRKVLENAALTEQKSAAKEQRPAREVFGVYVGWRGLSLKVPVLEFLTFWDRKNTAAQVGTGDVTELLSRIELVKRTKDAVKVRERVEAVTARCENVKQEQCTRDLNLAKTVRSDTRLVVIGHSFGGLVMQSAIDRILIDRAIRTSAADSGVQGSIEGFGNLLVLINPAFEAQRFNSLFQIQDERKTYLDDQLPVELVLTSRVDYATKFAFPAGRAVSTTFEKEGWDSKNLTALGHYEPFVTHELSTPPAQLEGLEQYADCFNDPKTIAQSWFSGDQQGNRHILGGLVLERKQLSERSPFLNVKVSGDLITGHNDIDDPLVIQFASRMINLSAMTENQKQSAAVSAKSLQAGAGSSLRTCDLPLR